MELVISCTSSPKHTHMDTDMRRSLPCTHNLSHLNIQTRSAVCWQQLCVNVTTFSHLEVSQTAFLLWSVSDVLDDALNYTSHLLCVSTNTRDIWGNHVSRLPNYKLETVFLFFFFFFLQASVLNCHPITKISTLGAGVFLSSWLVGCVFP